MLMAIELPTHLVDLTVGAIADHLDKLKDASGILQERKESELLNIVELQGECQQIIQSKPNSNQNDYESKAIKSRQSENFKQRKKLRQRHEMRTGRGLYTENVTLNKKKTTRTTT